MRMPLDICEDDFDSVGGPGAVVLDRRMNLPGPGTHVDEGAAAGIRCESLGWLKCVVRSALEALERGNAAMMLDFLLLSGVHRRQ